MADQRPDIPLFGLLLMAADAMRSELWTRVAEAGFGDLRPLHGCVFRNVPKDGLRLTEIAEAAGITKQAVGEVVSDLEGLGYVERVPDPADKRAKIIRLTEPGQEAQDAGTQALAEIEARWAEQVGPERIADMRAALLEVLAAEAPALQRAA